MPFRQRVARKLGETVSKGPEDSDSISTTTSQKEQPETSDMTSSLDMDMSAGPAKAKTPKGKTKKQAARAEKTLGPIHANRVTKRAGGATSRPPVTRQQYQRVARVTRSSSRLTADDDQLSPEKAYLSYHDILLTYEDVKALKTDWLTDNNIAFWEEWLEREILPKYPQASIVLLRPSMTFLLMKDPDVKCVTTALPNFSKVTHIFLPINDNRNVAQAEGGSHWSLLLVSTIDRVAFHYDSLGGANCKEAQHCTRQLSHILKTDLKYQQIDDCPQQENGSDCGVFVCILMRHLLVKRLLNANAREKVSMSMANKIIDSYGARKEMMKIIESLRKEGERRRSASPFASSHTPRIE